MNDIAIVYALFPDRASAELAAVQMVDRQLAACANVQAPCLSVYRWEGKLEQSEEVPVIFKTAPDKRALLTAALAAAHSYKVPAISSWIASTTGDYGAWVASETRD